MATLPYPENPGATHYPGCWRDRGHHNCAVQTAEAESAKVEALRVVNRAMRDLLQEIRESTTPEDAPETCRQIDELFGALA